MAYNGPARRNRLGVKIPSGVRPADAAAHEPSPSSTSAATSPAVARADRGHRGRGSFGKIAGAGRGDTTAGDLLAGLGQNGDTMVAHVNQAEAELLAALGGSGRRNPRTGLIEFAPADFNAQAYLSANPDVAAWAKTQPDPNAAALQHYTTYGQAEGRSPTGAASQPPAAAPTSPPPPPAAAAMPDGFNPSTYLGLNPDVAAAAKSSGQDPNAFAVQHYQTWGNKEDRQFQYALPQGWNAGGYLANNPDVAAAVSAGKVTPNQHYQMYGGGEGRTFSPPPPPPIPTSWATDMYYAPTAAPQPQQQGAGSAPGVGGGGAPTSSTMPAGNQPPSGTAPFVYGSGSMQRRSPFDADYSSPNFWG